MFKWYAAFFIAFLLALGLSCDRDGIWQTKHKNPHETPTPTPTPGDSPTPTPTPGDWPDLIDLGSAGAFGILAGAGVTSTGPTVVTGDLGVSPGVAVSGFPPGIVNGNIHAGDPVAAQAKLDLTDAFNEAAGLTLNSISLPGNLGGLTLAPGLYTNSTSTMISGSGPLGILTLDAGGNAAAVWVFQMGSTLTTDPGTSVVLSGGALAENIFWQVGTSATIGTTCIFKGNILADQSITINTGATLDGRALTRIAAITMDANIVTIP